MKLELGTADEAAPADVGTLAQLEVQVSAPYDEASFHAKRVERPVLRIRRNFFDAPLIASFFGRLSQGKKNVLKGTATWNAENDEAVAYTAKFKSAFIKSWELSWSDTGAMTEIEERVELVLEDPTFQATGGSAKGVDVPAVEAGKPTG